MTHPLTAAAEAAGKSEKNRTAIVLASFGSTVPEARKVEASFLEETRRRHPGVHAVLANTARLVMRKNAGQGVVIPSLFRALADLVDAGYARAAVQSLHLAPGDEFDGVAAVAKAQEGLPKGLRKVSLGAPLLASDEDCAQTADVLAASLPEERNASEPVIFVRHEARSGPNGQGDGAYAALQRRLARRDPKMFVGLLKDIPDRERILALLGVPDEPPSPVWLAPLLGLAGRHALTDLYGDGDHSWKRALEEAGWQVKESFRPLLAIPGARDIWFAHLDAALAELAR
ncbi:MAG: sirohydrochlorin cobaltochelatase [Deltaproteobacteria bacterium]|jgi:sirohydrochlorin cobaltochelatase|nr:sirohydrochlorin cobaltochelatase [Deltaproteobacteria bacterium]